MTFAKRFTLGKLLWMLCFTVALFVIAFLFDPYTKKYLQLKTGHIFNASVVGNSQSGEIQREKPFAYYVLTGKCLSPYLLEHIALGDSQRCDVYVNSYKEKCDDQRTPKHITYFFNKTTTWSTGRNLLFKKAQDTRRRYSYHIFMDDDVMPIYTEHYDQFAKTFNFSQDSIHLYRKYLISEMGLKEAIYLKKDGKSAWRAFEDDLVANSPAFGVSNFAKGRGGYYFESRQTSRKYYQEVCPKGKEMPSVAPTFFLDECFIGFHHEAATVLLPYTTMFEEINWTLSGIIDIIRARALFYRQGMANYKITVINTDHRPYPLGRIPTDFIAQYLAADGKDIQGLIDDNELILDLNNWDNWEKKFFRSKALCMAPLKYPVVRQYRKN